MAGYRDAGTSPIGPQSPPLEATTHGTAAATAAHGQPSRPEASAVSGGDLLTVSPPGSYGVLSVPKLHSQSPACVPPSSPTKPHREAPASSRVVNIPLAARSLNDDSHSEIADADLPEWEAVESLSLSYPSTAGTPVRVYRYSDHIHKDRHIFLKGASLGIGCGDDCDAGGGFAGASLLGDHALSPEWGGGSNPWTGASGGGIRNCLGQSLDMALDNERLPALSRVHLDLPSAGLHSDRRRHHHHLQQSGRFPHPHQPSRRHGLGDSSNNGGSSGRRPFNEQLNTYVDTQKRIRAVQNAEDLYRAAPSPSFPYLATPSSPRRPPPPAPARLRVAIPRLISPHAQPALERYGTSVNLGQPQRQLQQQSGHRRNDLYHRQRQRQQRSSAELSRSSRVAARTAANVNNASTAPITITNNNNTTSRGSTTDSPNSQNTSSRTSRLVNGSTVTGNGSSRRERLEVDLDSALLDARHKLRGDQEAFGGVRDYPKYFMDKEGREGTLGRLFESYPKRVLTVCPGRVLRQRTDIVSRSRPRPRPLLP